MLKGYGVLKLDEALEFLHVSVNVMEKQGHFKEVSVAIAQDIWEKRDGQAERGTDTPKQGQRGSRSPSPLSCFLLAIGRPW